MGFFKIAGYPVDCAMTEEPTFSSDITKFPTEKRGSYSDNIQRKPIQFKFEGLISDTPIGAIALDPSRQALTGNDIPSKFAYAFFLSIHNAGEPVTIETSFGKFDDMALASLVPTKDQKTGKALKFTANFEQLQVLENKRTTVAVAVPRAAGKQNLGNLLSPAQFLENIAGIILVTSFPTSGRATLRKSLGEPVFTRRGSNELDCYRKQGAMVADGYLTANSSSVSSDKYTYHPMSSVPNTGPDTNVAVPAKPNVDKPVHYNYGRKQWEDDTGSPVTKRPPPDDSAWGKVKRGAGI